MKRNLALLLAGIMSISPLSPAMAVSADTDPSTMTVIAESDEEAAVQEMPEEAAMLQEGDLAEAVEAPVAEESEILEAAGTEETASVSFYYFADAAEAEGPESAGTEAEGFREDIPVSMKEGDTLLLVIRGRADESGKTPALPKEVVWECSDPEIAALDEKGAVTAQKEGTATIFASFTVQEQPYTLSLTVEVSAAELQEAPVEETVPAEGTEAAGAVAEEVPEAEAAEEAPEELPEEILPEEELPAEEATEEILPGEEIPAEVLPEEELESSIGTISAEATASQAAAASVISSGSMSGKWKKSNGLWQYVNADGSLLTGSHEIDGVNYYFDTSGNMLTGWVKLQQKWYYYDADGAQQTGWLKNDGHWYYMDPENNGAMVSGTFIEDEGSTYYLDKSGVMRTGWVEINDSWYAFNRSGAMHRGWILYNSKWYYLDPDSGKMIADTVMTIKEKHYVFASTGAMLSGGWFLQKGTYYYLQEEGDALTGSQKIDGVWYYLDPAKKGAMAVGLVNRDGAIYLYASSGKLRQDAFLSWNNEWYYGDSDGKMHKGWLQLGNTWYFFGSTGVMQTGWIEWKNRWCYMSESGAMLASTFVTVNGKRYYLGEDGYLYRSAWFCIGGTWYYADGNGALKTGTATIGGQTYEFASDGSWIVPTASYSNRSEFIALMAKLVRKYAPQYGVKVYSPIIAQAILESAYGESTLGKKYNNFFGLKCGTLWKGKSVSLKTGEEYSPGTYTTITANFRVYDSIEEGVRGYFVFLFEGRTRYNNLIGVTDPRTYLQNIKDDGYATSSKYVQNCMNVVTKYNLTQYDD